MRKVPNGRRSPVKHIVHKHVRAKRPVRQYRRGTGKKKDEYSKRSMFDRREKVYYMSTVNYEDGKTSGVRVSTPNVVEALERTITSSAGVPKSIILIKHVEVR